MNERLYALLFYNALMCITETLSVLMSYRPTLIEMGLFEGKTERIALLSFRGFCVCMLLKNFPILLEVHCTCGKENLLVNVWSLTLK